MRGCPDKTQPMRPHKWPCARGSLAEKYMLRWRKKVYVTMEKCAASCSWLPGPRKDWHGDLPLAAQLMLARRGSQCGGWQASPLQVPIDETASSPKAWGLLSINGIASARQPRHRGGLQAAPTGAGAHASVRTMSTRQAQQHTCSCQSRKLAKLNSNHCIQMQCTSQGPQGNTGDAGQPSTGTQSIGQFCPIQSPSSAIKPISLQHQLSELNVLPGQLPPEKS
jgi:hypothetical protein